jgi:hypothetical protein
VRRKAQGLDDKQARWTPDGHLISVVGIVRHLTLVEWRWLDGGFLGADVHRSEEEFHPSLALADALEAYQERAAATERLVRTTPLDTHAGPTSWAQGHDLRFVLLHLINETARHAGHADATRELLDGVTGE